MPRRPRTSPADALVAALSRLPWWTSIALGIIGYLILHEMASRSPPAVSSSAPLQGLLWDSILRAAAYVFQFVLPILCLAAATISFIGRRKRRLLLLEATDGGAPAAAIDAMSWQDFELLIAEGFRLQGFEVLERGGASADGGVDLELTRHGERWLVQAKHWRARQVPVEVVRELAGVMPFRRAVGAFVVTSGRFTAPAQQFARGRGIELINGARLTEMLTRARGSLSSGTLQRNLQKPTSTAAAELADPPSCPQCERSMVLRKAKRGANAGKQFWGCSQYAQGCRGTRPI